LAFLLKEKVPNCFAQRTSTCLKRAYNLIGDPVPDPAGGHLYVVVPIPVLQIFWTSRTGHQQNKAGGHSYMNYVDF
jgi:hypothetical protein